MKTLILFLTFVSFTYSQSSSDSLIEKRFENIEYNTYEAGYYLSNAKSSFSQAILFPLVGSIASGILLGVMDKTADGNISLVVPLPAVIGSIIGIVSYLSGAGDLDEAGLYLKEIKRNKKKK